jgi:hypothetical protein
MQEFSIKRNIDLAMFASPDQWDKPPVAMMATRLALRSGVAPSNRPN